MSGYESPNPETESADNGLVDDALLPDGLVDVEGSGPDGAMGAGPAEGADLAAGDGGDATGGGSPGDPDAMGAEDSPTPDDEAHLQDLP